MGSTLNTLPVIDGYVSVPRMGAWIADVLVNTTGVQKVPAEGDAATFTIDNLSLKGRVTFVNTQVTGRAIVRAVGGNGGLILPIPSQTFAPAPTFSNVLNSMLSSGGELAASSKSDAATMNGVLNSFTAFADVPLSNNVTRLVQDAGPKASWRCDPATGAVTVYVNDFTTTISMPTSYVVNDASQDGGVTYEAPFIDNVPMPGTNDVNGEPVNEVIFFVHENQTQFQLKETQVSTIVANPSFELDATYAGAVIQQNADGTVDVTPDDQRFGGNKVGSCRIRQGASATWSLQQGARVLFEFDNGDPARPFIVAIDGWYAGDFLSNVAYGNPAAAQFLARGDIIDSFINVFLNKWVPVPNDGGAALQTALKAWILTPPWVTNSQSTQCKRIKSD